MSLGIVTALDAETKTLTERGAGHTSRVIPLAPQVLLIQGGVGPQRARQAGVRLLAEGAQALLSWGCAGALDATLKAGDLLLPVAVKSAESNLLVETSAYWREYLWRQLSPLAQLHSGMLLSSPNPVLTPIHKRSLAVRSGAVAVDMESAAIGSLAQEAKVPFMVIRAIADCARMNVPSWLVASLDAGGAPRLGQLLHGLLRHPRDGPALIRLGLGLHAAQMTLITVAQHMEVTLSRR